jgi:hypothetical protein
MLVPLQAVVKHTQWLKSPHANAQRQHGTTFRSEGTPEAVRECSTRVCYARPLMKKSSSCIKGHESSNRPSKLFSYY